MKYLGLDWGLKKIGLAVSEGELASPWGIINVQKNSLDKAVAKVKAVVEREEVEYIILGKPEGEMGKIIEKAAEALKKQDLDVSLVDETLSTQDAKRLMLEMGMRKRARKEDNAVAAALILQRYLDER